MQIKFVAKILETISNVHKDNYICMKVIWKTKYWNVINRFIYTQNAMLNTDIHVKEKKHKRKV